MINLGNKIPVPAVGGCSQAMGTLQAQQAVRAMQGLKTTDSDCRLWPGVRIRLSWPWRAALSHAQQPVARATTLSAGQTVPLPGPETPRSTAAVQQASDCCVCSSSQSWARGGARAQPPWTCGAHRVTQPMVGVPPARSPRGRSGMAVAAWPSPAPLPGHPGT